MRHRPRNGPPAEAVRRKLQGARRRAGGAFRPGRSWRVLPLALVPVLALALLSQCGRPGTGGPPLAGADMHTSTPSGSAAPSETASDPCPTPRIRITSPRDGAALRPGEVMIAGVDADPDGTELWMVSKPDGSVVSSGFADGGGAADPTAFTALVHLDAGSYTVTVRTVDDEPASSCSRASVSLSVSDSVTGPTWISGASGVGVKDGSFAAWRGSPLQIAGTWVDNNAGQLKLWPLQPGGDLAQWRGDLDISVGAIGPGETWAAAARGAYDSRWATSLQRLAQLWAGRPGTVYIRFAHEFNGNWYPWGVTAGEAGDFIAAWKRFRALQLKYFPASRLVFSPNSETPGQLNLDWRAFFPGKDYVDVISVSYFNAYSLYAGTPAQFWQQALARDSFGAPIGIERHLEFARSVGLPFAVSEWGPNAKFGDGRVYMEQMNQFFRENAGTGPGQLLYEVLFNVVVDNNSFAVMPQTRVPEAADAYRRLW